MDYTSSESPIGDGIETKSVVVVEDDDDDDTIKERYSEFSEEEKRCRLRSSLCGRPHCIEMAEKLAEKDIHISSL